MILKPEAKQLRVLPLQIMSHIVIGFQKVEWAGAVGWLPVYWSIDLRVTVHVSIWHVKKYLKSQF